MPTATALPPEVLANREALIAEAIRVIKPSDEDAKKFRYIKSFVLRDMIQLAKERGATDTYVAEEEAEAEPEPEEEKAPRVNGQHKLVPKLLQLLGAKVPVYLHGAPGAGKTHAAEQVAKLLDVPFYSMSMNPQSSRSEFVGLKSPFTGDVFGTQFTEWLGSGGVLFLDELDNSHPAMLTALNSLFANGYIDVHGERKLADDGCLVVGAGNTAGRGGSRQHANRFAFDGATRSRFVYLEWEYDHDLEDEIVLPTYPSAKKWLEWVRKVRAYAGKHDSPHYGVVDCGMREAIYGAKLIEAGVPALEVAEMVTFRGCSVDVRTNVVNQCPTTPLGSAKQAGKYARQGV